MSQTITAIFENGVFKPLEKVDVPEHKRLKIILANEVDRVAPEESNLIGIIDIAKDCYDMDLSVQHDKYLYGEVPS